MGKLIVALGRDNVDHCHKLSCGARSLTRPPTRPPCGRFGLFLT
jgi:hypothetical protein